ncbi:MAG: amidohydrolase family protein [Candidatus Rifleibacteriota bacterium]
MLKLFRNGRILKPDFNIEKANILIQDETIYDILNPDEEPRKTPDAEIDLEGQAVFPGLINAHDHLIDTCWKGIGNYPAENWYEWDSSVKASPEYKAMQMLSVTDLYILGMYKNIVSGATTVVDHFPSEVSKTFFGHPLVSLLEHLTLAHSASNYQLQWGRNIAEEFRNARGVIPFIIHLGEGNSREIKEELETLNRLDVLSSNTVLVNCAHLSEADFQLIKSKNSSIVWLPTSSQRILNKELNIKAVLEHHINLAIGTDSSITGSLGMLEEIKTALRVAKEKTEGEIKEIDILKMATINAARMFGIEKNCGTVQPGKCANLIVFPCKEDADPIKEFFKLTFEQLSMVIHKGVMIAGNDEFRKVSAIDFNLYSEVKLNNVSKILYGRPAQLIERISHKLNMNVQFPFFPIQSED